ncbi:MAG: bis(5'-nucleosyl)-tetraphosphatase (symmetrical) YqeK [Porcipelethomonas sp.]
MYDTDEIKSFLKERLSKKRYTHSINVASEAQKLAKHYGADPKKAYIAGLLHDICKEIPHSEQEELMLEGDMYLSGEELSSKALWHGPAGAYYVKAYMGIKDEEILNSIRYHTVGRSGMSLLEEIIYMADLISEDRSYKDVDKMRKTAYSDLNRALLEALCFSVRSVAEKGGYIPHYTIDAYNQYTFVCSLNRKNKEKNDEKR